MTSSLTAYLARIELRRQVRVTVLLALLVALVVGTVLTATAGSRRTSTSFDRYLALYAPTELYAGGDLELLEQIRDIEGVESVSTFELAAAVPAAAGLEDFFPLMAPHDQLLGQSVMVPPIVQGRAADPAEPLEVVVGQRTARRLGLSVGGTLELVTWSPEGAEAIFAEHGTAEPDGPPITLQVVGIQREPGDLGGRQTDIAFTILTPAFLPAYRGQVGDIGVGSLVDVVDGHPVGEVVDELRALGVEELDQTLSGGFLRSMTDPVITSLATALALFAAVAALAGGVAVAQVAGRSIGAAMADDAPLAALGCRPRDRMARVLAPPLAAVMVGTAVGALVSVAASPLHPIGLARRADPDLGVQVDGLVLAAGVLVALAAGTILLVAVALLALRRAGRGQVTTAPGRAVTVAADAGAPVPVVAGLGFAATRRSASAGPTRAAVAGAVVGVLGILAALIVGASMDRLTHTPALYGWGWDAVAAGSDMFHLDDDEIGERLAADPDVVAAEEVVFGLAIDVDGQPVFGIVHEPRTAGISPVVVRGRAPGSADEVALGGDTARGLGVGLGDEVRLNLRTPVPATVVGIVALPVSSDGGASASGALLTPAAADAMGFPGTCAEDATCYRNWAVDLADGADPTEVTARALGPDSGAELTFPTPPGEVEQLRAIEHLPWVLAGFLAALAVVALLHAAVATVRRRRRDLALLRTLGCTARQLRATIVVQVAALTVGGAALGTLLGVVAGRQVWALVVDRMSLPFSPDVPLLAVLIVPIATVLLAQLAATPTRRAAGAVRPATTLRAE